MQKTPNSAIINTATTSTVQVAQVDLATSITGMATRPSSPPHRCQSAPPSLRNRNEDGSQASLASMVPLPCLPLLGSVATAHRQQFHLMDPGASGSDPCLYEANLAADPSFVTAMAAA